MVGNAMRRSRRNGTRKPVNNVIRFSLAAITAAMVLALLMAGTTTAQAAAPLPDFSVDTFNGPYVFSEQKGKTLIYFFSFPG